MKFGRQKVGILITLVGAVFVLNSFSGVTGFVVFEDVFGGIWGGWSFVVGIVFVAGGIFVFILSEEGLEGRVAIYELRNRQTRNHRMTMMRAPVISDTQVIQLNREIPIDEYHINLNELGDPVYRESMGKEEKLGVEKKLRESIYKGYKNLLSGRSEEKLRNMSKDKRCEIAKSIRIARDVEKAYKLFRPEYETRREAISRLKHNKGSGNTRFHKSIESGKVTYVHFTSDLAAEKIKERGLDVGKYGAQYALAFPTRREAMFWVKKMKPDDAAKMTGANKIDSAVIFQTVSVPDIMPPKGKRTSIYPRVLFRQDVVPESIYFSEIKKISH